VNCILVVCEGNICRSPIAAGLLRAEFPTKLVRSAGLTALVGSPADSCAIRLMHEEGIDITEHRAVQITRALCLSSDIVLVMDNEQRRRIEALYPSARGRVFRVGEYTKQDIPDPYRLSEWAFRSALTLLREAVREWATRIRTIETSQ
jgi:protein-tyrosine phosphatase